MNDFTSKVKLSNKVILITGGTGTFGKACVDHFRLLFPDVRLRIFSRDEFKQAQLREKYGSENISYMLGDVRDLERLRLAFRGVDYVFHAAALKHVTAGEYNPREFIETNIIGTENVCRAAIDSDVKEVITLASDKGVNPVNLYGATKLVAEKSTIQHNSYTPNGGTVFKAVRYGNVAGSRGSAIGIFRRALESGDYIPVTHIDMTRFWMLIEEAVTLVTYALCAPVRGGTFIPNLPAFKVVDLVDAIAGKDYGIKTIGIRAGEKLHEVLMTDWERQISFVNETGFVYIIPPEHHDWNHTPLHEKFERASFSTPYRSDVWKARLSSRKLRSLVKGVNDAE
jgi:FlaA1/EpsC-like NDP-sugar epimerase